MSLEQETLNYVYYCDSLMLTNILNPHLAAILRNINRIIQIPFIWPSDPHYPEKKWSISPRYADWSDPVSTLGPTIKYY